MLCGDHSMEGDSIGGVRMQGDSRLIQLCAICMSLESPCMLRVTGEEPETWE